MSGYPQHKLAELLDLADAGTWGDVGVEGSDNPVLRSSNIQASKLDLTEYAWRRVPENHIEKKALVEGDIIVTMSSGSPTLIGKCCIFRQPPDKRTYYFSNFTLRIRPNKALLDSRWLHYWLSSPRGRTVLEAMNSTTSGLRNLNRKLYLDQKVPLPPLEEQKRIAAILDKADAVRRKRQESIRLTEEFLRSVFLDMFGDPVTNPKGWKMIPLGQVIEKIESGWSPKCDTRLADEGEWGVLKLGAVTSGYYIDGENKALLSETTPRRTLEVLPGDLLFSRKNTYELVGATAYVYATRQMLMISDLIFRLKLGDNLNAKYLWQMLSNKTTRQKIRRLASGTAGSMPNVSKSRLRTLLVPVPPLHLQEAYSEIVEKNNSIQSKYLHRSDDSDNLFNSFIQRAFI